VEAPLTPAVRDLPFRGRSPSLTRFPIDEYLHEQREWGCEDITKDEGLSGNRVREALPTYRPRVGFPRATLSYGLSLS